MDGAAGAVFFMPQVRTFGLGDLAVGLGCSFVGGNLAFALLQIGGFLRCLLTGSHTLADAFLLVGLALVNARGGGGVRWRWHGCRGLRKGRASQGKKRYG